MNLSSKVKRYSFFLRAKVLQKSPFVESLKRPLIIHGSYHKVGTVWFRNILSSICCEYGLRFLSQTQEFNTKNIPHKFDACIHGNSQFNFNELREYTGSHMTRDPRDMIISGYHYHKWTKEAWVHESLADFAKRWEAKGYVWPYAVDSNMTYQQLLNSVDNDLGIEIEMRRFSRSMMPIMTDWDYANPKIFEIKYHEIMQDEKAVLRLLFEHYGFHDEAVRKCLKLAEKFSFKNMKGKQNSEAHHLRSGKSNQWKTEFSDKHIALFKELHGQDLITLGYESNLNW